MTPAFWDSSSLVPLCLAQQPSGTVLRLLSEHSMVVWWGTSVEIRSAIERLARETLLSGTEYHEATTQLGRLRRTWREMEPNQAIRFEAERLLALYPLKAADALHLAAALVWSARTPQPHVFISGDAQLLRAAHLAGFQTIRT